MNRTEAQQKAIDSGSPDILVVAGPGAGKTATTVARIWRVIESGVDPRKIVALSFTNAAAKELEERVAQACPACCGRGFFERESRSYGGGVIQEQCERCGDLELGYVGTLHGFALRMLKRHGEVLGYGERVALIGEDAANELLLAKAAQVGCKLKLDALLKLKAVARVPGGRLKPEEIAIASYYSDLREAGLVDFDTILTEFCRLLAMGAVPAEFTHLFVDERQDSARIDCEIYARLPIANKFQVGDPDQSIYAFRGGRPDLMMMWPREFEACEVIMLEENFRSRAEICEAAQRLIEHNERRFAKRTLSTRGPGGAVSVVGVQNEGEEQASVVREIQALVAMGESAAECAVLARTNAIAHGFREQLTAAGIAVAAEEKCALPHDWPLAKALVDLMVNPENDTLASFVMQLTYARGMSVADARKRVTADGIGARSAMRSLNRYLDILPRAPYFTHDVGPVLANFGLSAESRMMVATILGQLPQGAELLDVALAMAAERGTVTEAVAGCAVLTIHGAKGREWDHVFLVGWEEEVISSKRDDLEEARRLAYVALTRARERAFITWSRVRRTSWGAMEQHSPSRFINELLSS